MSPVAITSDSEGNLYVGDYDYIRMIDADGNVENLFTFPHPPSAKVDRFLNDVIIVCPYNYCLK